MKTMKMKTLVGAVALAAALSSAAEATTLKLSHVRPQDTAIDDAATAFAEDVSAATDGELSVRLFPANALGDYTVVQERVSLGAIDMAVQPPSSGADKRFQLAYLPYLVQSWEEAREVFRDGAPMRKEVEGIYADQNIHVLAAWPVYFGGVALNSEVENAADPNADKGAKLRVPPMKSFQLMADNIGYIGSPLPFSDAFTAVQTGVVDGVMGSGAEGYYASFRDVTNYYLPLNTHFEMWYLLINQDIYDELDESEQVALDEAAARFEAARWEGAEADQARNEQLLAEAGGTIVPVSDEQIAGHAEIVRDSVWPVILEDIGADWANSVLDQAIR
ncbi:TRAP transporter substrate-binding protein DctP [Halomonas beimenensis]|uniref:TRAP-type C4-dicarboxylate transport system, periplasmic component n=1 Tax=Halomonas beimenensis TaxID=475662 RepID=A0A291PBW2_9GAMM|nr:TRAP transporter substrate-binding protein DctP [Halomonas beimenensis]ATJ84339.1 TRAP-type C4-dicarboxylate transport system, periplasmic component [Halomonas beimenensis]